MYMTWYLPSTMNIEQMLVRIPNITVLTDFNTEFANPRSFFFRQAFFFFLIMAYQNIGNINQITTFYYYIETSQVICASGQLISEYRINLFSHPLEFPPVDGGTQNFQNYEGKLSFQHKSVIESYNKMFQCFLFFFLDTKKTFFCSFRTTLISCKR